MLSGFLNSGLNFILVLMIIRVYATWNRSRPILILCLCALFLNTGSYTSLFGIYYATMEFAVTEPSALCQPVSIPFTKIYISLIFALAFETMIIILIAIKSYPIVRQRASRFTLYAVLFEDGLAYYCIIALAHAIILVFMFNINTVTISLLGSSFTFTVIGIAVHRITLRAQSMLLRTGSVISTSPVSADITITGFTFPVMNAEMEDFSDEEMESRNRRRRNRYRF